MRFQRVPAEVFEAQLVKRGEPNGIDTERDYRALNCFLALDEASGYAISPTNELKFVFSLRKGCGADAVRDAIIHCNPLHLNCFDGKLREYYESFGFSVYQREKNWTEGEPDVVYMSRDEGC
jgi:hypothetical protein